MKYPVIFSAKHGICIFTKITHTHKKNISILVVLFSFANLGEISCELPIKKKNLILIVIEENKFKQSTTTSNGRNTLLRS